MTGALPLLPDDPAARHDPGGRTRLRLPGGVAGTADFSECGRYRYRLARDWTAAGASPKSILWIGMNPSVADAGTDDPTCARELRFSRDWGFTRYLKGNILDWRATAPRDIPPEPERACSAANLPAIAAMAAESAMVVLAYGKLHPRFQPSVAAAIETVRDAGHTPWCLGTNKDGSARHPLYLRADTAPFPFPTP